MNKIFLKPSSLNVYGPYKSLARYFTQPTTYPSPYPKPMNPWDNLDPGRKDKEMVDEYDL